MVSEPGFSDGANTLERKKSDNFRNFNKRCSIMVKPMPSILDFKRNGLTKESIRVFDCDGLSHRSEDESEDEKDFMVRTKTP